MSQNRNKTFLCGLFTGITLTIVTTTITTKGLLTDQVDAFGQTVVPNVAAPPPPQDSPSTPICPTYSGTLSSLAEKYTPTKFFPYLHTGYHRIYDFFFESFRRRKTKMLEIGIDSGRGTLLWKEYLPCSELYGIEYNDNSGTQVGRQVANIFQGDQANRTFLNEFIRMTGGNFDIIIDDGGHSFLQQMTSYSVLFQKALKPGGIYVIEDIETSYWDEGTLYGQNITGGVNVSRTTVANFKNMVDVVNRKFHDNLYKVVGPVDWWIKGVSFYQNVIVIHKKTEADRPYDSHYVWPSLLKPPAKFQGNEFSYGPSPYTRDDRDMYWLKQRHAPKGWQAKYMKNIRTWDSRGRLYKRA